MRILKRLLIILVVIVLIFAGVAVYFLANAKRIVLSKMEESLGVPVQATAFRMTWPLSVEIEGLTVGKNIQVQRLQVVPGLAGMLSGGLVFDSILIDRPAVKVVRSANNAIDIGLPACKQQSKVSFVMRKLDVESGKVEFVDASFAQPLTLFVDQIKAHAKQASLVQLTHIDFDASASVTNVRGERAALAEAKGWIDWLPKDLNATITISAVDMPSFSPYLKQRIKRDIQTGNAQATADLKAEHNDLKAQCHVELSNVSFRVEGEAAAGQGVVPNFSDMTSLTLNSFLSAEGGAVFDFSIRTKLDHPKFENLKIKGSFLQSQIQSAMANPEQAAEKYQQIGQQFKEIGKEFKKIFKGN